MLTCSFTTCLSTYSIGARVQLEVEEVTKDKKVIIFKSRRRKNSKSKNGFRRHVTVLRVTDIVIPEEHRSIL